MSRNSGSVIGGAGGGLAANVTTGVWTMNQVVTKKATNNWPSSQFWNQYQISRSLRFNSADSAYLNRTPASAGNRRTWTWSGWVKRTKFGSDEAFFSGGTSDPITTIRFSGDGSSEDGLFIFHYAGGGFAFNLTTTAQFRDPSAWYHIVVACDTTQATSTNRLKLYVNGTQVTAFDTATYPSQNYDTSISNNVLQTIGTNGNGANYFNGYLTEVNFIDGYALDPSYFGVTEPSTGVWVPKAFDGAYGTNGFYLNFSDNSNTTAGTLGKDSSGNGNNWTPNNFSVTAGAGNDSLVDTPTSYGTDTGVGGEVRGNYCTWNPLSLGTNLSTLNGNLDVKNSTAENNHRLCRSTFGITTGKWFWEYNVNDSASIDILGVATSSSSPNSYVGETAGSAGYGYSVNPGLWYAGSGWTMSGASPAGFPSGGVIGVAFDADNGKIWFSRNGTWINSGDPAAGTNANGTFVGTAPIWVPAVSIFNGTGTWPINFGQRPFANTAPSGFKALCTQNLPTPTIGAEAGFLASRYFDTTLYTGTGASLSVTNTGGFQPDFVWLKSRSAATNHQLFDVARGTTKVLVSNSTEAESTSANTLTSFNSSGFTVGTNTAINTASATYVGWQWKAGGATVTNTSGSITSQVSANTTAGFSIVTYTGTGTGTPTVGHGLGVAPSMIIVKSRSNDANWAVGHTSEGFAKAGLLNATNAFGSSTYFGSTTPTSTLFYIQDTGVTNISSATYVAYCFAPVAGYSAFGSYTGNGSTDGVFVYTGFRPRYILVKSSSNAYQWSIHDTARQTYNEDERILSPNSSSAEDTNSLYGVDVLSNGFKWRNSGEAFNYSGYTYIYAAFAEFPFKYALAR